MLPAPLMPGIYSGIWSSVGHTERFRRNWTLASSEALPKRPFAMHPYYLLQSRAATPLRRSDGLGHPRVLRWRARRGSK